jgi:DNA polymerase-3 subunit delta
MKITPARADAFVAKPDPAARLVLVYGPDAGLVRERAARLCLTVVEDLADPFRLVELTPASLRENPARLADEAAQISLMGGRRVLRLREANDTVASPLEGFLDAPAGDALVVVEAGDLPARSKLRALCESAENAAAIACYADDEKSVEALIRGTLREAGLAIGEEALDQLVASLGSDRGVTRRELEKLVLYVGGAGGTVRLEDVEACIGDNLSPSIDDALLAAAEGEANGAERALARAFAEGEAPVGVIRAAQRYFQRLHLAAAQVARGETPERVVDTMRPKVFWKQRSRLIAQLRLWSPLRAAQALERLTAAEIACKSTGMPDEALAMRCLLELAGFAARQRRQPTSG